MWELDHKEGWMLKNWCFQIMVLEKTLESHWNCKDIKPVNLKEINPKDSLEGLMLKLKLEYFGHWLIGKDSDSRKDRKQREKRVEEDEMVGWHHWLNGLEFEQTPGDNEEHGSLVCCSSWDRKELGHTLGTEWWQWQRWPRWVLISFRRTQRYCYVYSLRRNQDSSLSLYYCFLIAPLFLHSYFSLISNCLNLLFGTERGSRNWKKCN